MRFPGFQKRQKQQEKFVADHAQSASMFSLKGTTSFTGNAFEFIRLSNNIYLNTFNISSSGNVNISAGTATTIGGTFISNNTATFNGGVISNNTITLASGQQLYLDNTANAYLYAGSGTVGIQGLNWTIDTTGFFSGIANQCNEAFSADALSANSSCFLNGELLYFDGWPSYMYGDGAGTVFFSGNVTIPGNTIVSGLALTPSGTLTSSQPFTITEAWNNNITFSAQTTNVADTTSNSDSTFVDYQLNSVSKAKIDKRGVIYSTTPAQQLYQALNFGGF